MNTTGTRAADPRTARRRRRHPLTSALLVAGAVALAWTSGIHLRLYSAGYSHVPTIGPLFLMQGIVAAALSLLVLGLAVTEGFAPGRGATRRAGLLVAGVAAATAAFLVATIGGFLLSDWFGLFGLHDHLNSQYAGLSLVVEGVGAAVLLGAALNRGLPFLRGRPG